MTTWPFEPLQHFAYDLIMVDWPWRFETWSLAGKKHRTPEQQVEHDRAQHGTMVGFVLWNSARWREWEKATGWRGTSKSAADHAAYDAWLAEWRPVEQPAGMSIPTLFDLLAESEAA